MGLKIVEVIMRAEEEFAITIRDQEAELAVTRGALCEVVVEKLRERGEAPDENATWEKLRAVLATKSVNRTNALPSAKTRKSPRKNIFEKVRTTRKSLLR